jgi:hypothetical protein
MYQDQLELLHLARWGAQTQALGVRFIYLHGLMPRGSGSSISMGSGPEGLWLLGPENASGGRGVVTSRSPGPELAFRS